MPLNPNQTSYSCTKCSFTSPSPSGLIPHYREKPSHRRSYKPSTSRKWSQSTRRHRRRLVLQLQSKYPDPLDAAKAVNCSESVIRHWYAKRNLPAGRNLTALELVLSFPEGSPKATPPVSGTNNDQDQVVVTHHIPVANFTNSQLDKLVTHALSQMDAKQLTAHLTRVALELANRR